MKVYFIRHGEDVFTIQKIYQGPNSSLSEKGREQAHQVAERFANINFNLLVMSPFKRAKDTADIINERHNKKILESPLFAETKRPSEVIGKGFQDPETLAVYIEIEAHENDPHWRYSDEETFDEIRRRGIKALQFLVEHETDRIIVICHGNMLRVMMSIMQHGEDLSPELFYRFRNFAPTNNTGVTVCHYGNLRRGDTNKKGWTLISWNDHSHLE